MDVIKGANLALAFIIELCALVALGYWGFKTGDGTAAEWALGIGAPLVAAVVWGLFVAPKAAVTVSRAIRLLLKAIVFGSAAIALYAAGGRGLAVAFVVAVVINTSLMVLWSQER